ncbi:DUF461 domain-containing protein [Streptomyces asoensis]
MSSSLRRGVLAASAIAFSIASLAACGAGNDAQTLEIKPDNAAVHVGDIRLQNVVVITQPEPDSTGPAVIAATVFNGGDKAQTLQSIALDGGGSAELKPAKGKGDVTVPAYGSLVIGGKDNASAVFKDSHESLKDGDAQKVTFTFSETGAVSLRAFVVPAGSYFSSWGPTAIPSAAQSPSGSASPSGSVSPSGSQSGTPASGSASPSGSASASESAAGQ